MSLPAQVPFVLYTGNGSTTAFSIPFDFSSNNNNVEVILRDTSVDPVTETTQIYSTHYTISSTTLTMITAPPSTSKLFIGRSMAYVQTKDFLSSGAFLVEEAEDGLDKLCAYIQQLGAQADRAIKFQKSSTESNATIEDMDGNAGCLVVVNDDEDGLEYTITLADFLADVAAAAASAASASSAATASAVSASSASTSASASSASASAAAASAVAAAASAASAAGSAGTEAQEAPSGSGTAFTVSQTPVSNAARFKLYRNGLLLTITTDYTRSGTAITLVDSLDPSQSLVANYYY